MRRCAADQKGTSVLPLNIVWLLTVIGTCEMIDADGFDNASRERLQPKISGRGHFRLGTGPSPYCLFIIVAQGGDSVKARWGHGAGKDGIHRSDKRPLAGWRNRANRSHRSWPRPAARMRGGESEIL